MIRYYRLIEGCELQNYFDAFQNGLVLSAKATDYFVASKLFLILNFKIINNCDDLIFEFINRCPRENIITRNLIKIDFSGCEQYLACLPIKYLYFPFSVKLRISSCCVDVGVQS